MDKFLCEVFHRPGPDTICSRSCQGLRKLKLSLDPTDVRQRVLDALAKLERDASICPGRLSKTALGALGIALEEESDALSLLRETLFTMRQEGLLRFYQKNVLVPKAKGPRELKGPFRVKGKSWCRGEMLAKVFKRDVTKCVSCSGDLGKVAYITETLWKRNAISSM